MIGPVLRHAGDMSISVPPRLVLLHGHGGSATTFDGLARELDVVTPVAQHTERGHRSWWAEDTDGPTKSDLDTFELPNAPVIIGGFSQGAAMATALAAYHHSNIVGLIVVAGFLPDPSPKLERPINALCVHSEEDETVDPFLGARVARWAKATGGKVVQSEYPGGHTWNADVDQHILSWIAATHFDG
jgi:predicted esterase